LGKDGFFHSFVLHPRYAGWFGAKHPDTGLWRYSFRHDEEILPAEDIILERMRGALGMPDLPIEIVQTHRFDYSTGLLRQWREGNVLFAGDSAHWHSPWGGFGMNSGIQDSNNLAWKLDLVLKGVASDALLDTYQVERQSKALITVKSATYNSLHYQAIAEAVRVGEAAFFAQGKISPEAKVFLSQRVDPHGENSVLHTGYQLGTVYASNAVVATAQEAPTPELAHYIETTVPGVRAPHAWLIDQDGKRVSTIDLWGEEFVLIGYRAASHWPGVAGRLSNSLGVKIRHVSVGESGDYLAQDSKFGDLYGKDKDEMILVRPDGFIAAKLHSITAGDARDELHRVMRSVLGLESVKEPAMDMVL
jgi:hypothetical protein